MPSIVPGRGTAPPSAHRTVALLDCFPDEREMYAQFLTARGYRVIALEGGEPAETLQYVLALGTDAIVLRAGPRAAGERLLEVLQPFIEAQRLPLLVLTTDTDARTWARARECGAAAVYLLPVMPDDLARALRRFIDARRGQNRDAS